MTEQEQGEELPTAAEVTSHWNKSKRTSETVYGSHNLEKGDELVRRQDVEQKINELREKWPDDKAIRQLLEEVQNQ